MRTSSSFTLFIITLILALISIFPPIQFVQVELGGILHTFTAHAPKVEIPIFNLVTSMQVDWGKIAADNENLQRINSEQAEQIAQLKKTLKLKDFTVDKSDKTSIVAGVIDPETTVTQGYIYIDRGAADNIKNGYPIAVGGFLVGIVSETSRNFAKAKLVTSSDSKIAIRIASQLGFAQGVANLAIQCTGLNNDDEIVRGAEVEVLATSEFPQLGRFKLGLVGEIVSPLQSPTLTCDIDYPLSLSKLEFVKVVMP